VIGGRAPGGVGSGGFFPCLSRRRRSRVTISKAKVIKRCWEDEAFHRESDPVGTAVKYLEVPAANLPNIVVHEEPAGSWHIVLPARPADAGDLSDADLEEVAGGTGPIAIVSFVAAVNVVVAASVYVSIVNPQARHW
jgi:hypothetical protein